MPQAAMLKIANFGGAITQKGPLQASTKNEDQYVWVTAFRHEAAAKIDLKTGRPVEDGVLKGKPIVELAPFVIQKKIDFTTPKFHTAFKDGVELTPWKLHLWQIPASGPANNYFVITLKKAKIQSITMSKPPILTAGNMSPLHEVEEIAFTYESMEFESLGVPLGLDFGSQHPDTAQVKGPVEPPWEEVQARALVEKISGALVDKVKDAVKAKLVAEGLLTPDDPK